MKDSLCYLIIKKVPKAHRNVYSNINPMKEGILVMNIQFKKGVLELCVLSILCRKDCYGYELVNEISKNIAISEGTIYPLLRRLMNDELFTTYLKESTEGPPRKYYTITEKGRREQQALVNEWDHFLEGVNVIIRGEDTHE